MTNAMATLMNDKPKAPWIGVGRNGEWSTVDEAMRVCGLDFTVETKDLKFQYEDDSNPDLVYYGNVPGLVANVRSDSHALMGCVSNTYQLVQNEEIFSMLEPFIEAGGKVTAGGVTAQGLCFMIVTMEDANFGGDAYTLNVMATNSFNGQFPASLICSPVRIICQNMYRQLMKNTDNVARFRHSLNIGGKLDAMKAAYAMVGDYKSDFGMDIEKLKDRKAKHSIEEVVEYMYPYTNTDPNSPRYDYSRENVDEKRALYINKYYNSPTNSDFGTCFALVNSYYDYVSHDVPVRKNELEYKDQRFSKLVGGTMVKPKILSFMSE